MGTVTGVVQQAQEAVISKTPGVVTHHYLNSYCHPELVSGSFPLPRETFRNKFGITSFFMGHHTSNAFLLVGYLSGMPEVLRSSMTKGALI